jgi:N-formylglutamate amidohydrolase
MRVIGGLGTIARIVSEREEIYAEPLALEDALERIERLYRPFHGALTDILAEVRDTFGFSVLVDCHSMPSGETPSQIAARPDFVLGDRFGSSCDSRITRMIRQHLSQQRYRVQLNRPYAGGYITEHYGQPFAQQHSIQIEINRALYLDEPTFERGPGFAGLKAKMSDLIAVLSARVPSFFLPRAAAE